NSPCPRFSNKSSTPRSRCTAVAESPTISPSPTCTPGCAACGSPTAPMRSTSCPSPAKSCAASANAEAMSARRHDLRQRLRGRLVQPLSGLTIEIAPGLYSRQQGPNRSLAVQAATSRRLVAADRAADIASTVRLTSLRSQSGLLMTGASGTTRAARRTRKSNRPWGVTEERGAADEADTLDPCNCLVCGARSDGGDRRWPWREDHCPDESPASRDPQGVRRSPGGIPVPD